MPNIGKVKRNFLQCRTVYRCDDLMARLFLRVLKLTCNAFPALASFEARELPPRNASGWQRLQPAIDAMQVRLSEAAYVWLYSGYGFWDSSGSHQSVRKRRSAYVTACDQSSA